MRCLRSILLLILCSRCIEPFSPAINPQSYDLLVVDGFIDSDGTASVKLSRTMHLDGAGRTPIETGAFVAIVSSSGETFDLIETDSSIYRAANITVEVQSTYSLRIRTRNGAEYRSNDVQIHKTPEIESIDYNVSARGDELEIRTTSKDDNPGATGFYLFEGYETYEYHAPFFSGYKFINKTPIQRTGEEQVYVCWRESQTPTTIVNTNVLSVNTISAQRLVNISRSSQKIAIRYSILVRQRSISEEEYAFRDQLLKSTEQLGSLFSVIPGAVTGNVHSITNPGEYVLGYFRGQELKQKRLFIDVQSLPLGFSAFPGFDCQIDGTCRLDMPPSGPHICVEVSHLSDETIITNVVNDARGNPVQYLFVTPECGDCTAAGGTTVRPAFW